MRKLRLRPLLLAIGLALMTVSLVACVALKLVTDIMAARAEELVHAVTRQDKVEAAHQLMRIESWSRTGDYIAWGVAALVVLGSVAALLGATLAFRPLFDLAATMKRFSTGQRHARADRSAFVELARAADNFNEMADVITGQHSKMLQFLRGAAEELRDPVQVMRLALNAFVPGKPLPPDAVIRHRVTVMSREIDRLGHLLQTYLDASRVEWSRLDLQLGRANVCEIVEHAASMYRAFSAVHQVEVSVPDEPVWIHTDSSRLAQVIHTLVMFAIQSSPRGGVIEVMVGKEEAGVVVEVVDHGGLGIPKEHLGRVFEAFQEIATGRQIGPGTSVAMSVARRIVEAQKGRIEVTSELGEGSTFRVHVPFANSHLKHAPGAEARL